MVGVRSPRGLRWTVGTATVLVALIVWQVVGWGWLADFDIAAARAAKRARPNRDLFEVTVMLGLRGLILLACLPYLVWRGWRQKSWMPLVGFLGVLVLETGLLGAMKVSVGRSFPYQGDMVLEAGFLAFPSGHAGNVVSLWGYMAWHLSLRRPALAGLWWSLVGLFTLTVGVSSWLLRTHWPSDLVAGFLMGGAALVTVTTALRAADPLGRLAR